MFNPIKFLDDFNIPYWTEGKNCAPNFVNIQCPMCNDDSNHGGFHQTKGFYNCWECGHHWMEQVIIELTGLKFLDAKRLIEEYSSSLLRDPEEKEIIRPKSVVCPGNEASFGTHRYYLERRDFNTAKLAKEFGLKFTDWSYSGYEWRIMAPIYFDRQLVSYQGRAIKEQTPKYKACKMSEEVIRHKHVLYNIDNVPGDTVVLVEGITDVWRLGRGAVATFGTGFTKEQLNLISDRFKKVFICFDAEWEAEKRGIDIGIYLSSVGLDVETIYLDQDDPASLSQEYANKLMGELL